MAAEGQIELAQLRVCERYGAGFLPPDEIYKVGISASALRSERPLHGLRHSPESGTTGWFIWAREWSDDPNFFEPLHLYHLRDACPVVLAFLALPPGWRFLLADEYEDVWFDGELLTVR